MADEQDPFGEEAAPFEGDAAPEAAEGGDAAPADEGAADPFGAEEPADAPAEEAPADDAPAEGNAEDAFAEADMGGEEAGKQEEPEAEAEAQYDALREFNQQWRLQLEQKAQIARETQATLREQAADDIKKMYAEIEGNRETRQGANRQSEQKFLEDMEAQSEVENPWQRVTSLVDTNANPEESSDVSRLRSILVHLKNADAGPAIPADE